jgi:hypothetical protein
MIKRFHNWLFSKQPKKIIEIQGACKRCGKCCTNINLCEAGTWISKKSQFRKMVAEKPEYARLQIIGKNTQGTLHFSCTWLNSNNECKDYENRLDICKVFPNQMVITNQGEVPEGCGFTVNVHSSFDAVLRKTIRREKKYQRWLRFKNWILKDQNLLK